MMKYTSLLLLLPWLLLGCGTTVLHLADSEKAAIRCAENWEKQGFHFDPNSMTYSDMYQKVQDIRRAAYWAKQGYHFDPNVMTSEQMEQNVRNRTRAEYWKQKCGYVFDANSTTALEMDKRAKALETAVYWEENGYFYDPKSQKVFTDKSMRTELSSLASIHERGLGGLPAAPSGIFSGGYTEAIATTGGWEVVETTQIDGWVKKVRRGTIFKTVSGSLYEVAEPIFVSDMELRPKVTVVTDGQKCKLVIDGLEENPICEKLGKGHITNYPDSPVITGQIISGSDGKTFKGFEYGNIYRLDNGLVVHDSCTCG